MSKPGYLPRKSAKSDSVSSSVFWPAFVVLTLAIFALLTKQFPLSTSSLDIQMWLITLLAIGAVMAFSTIMAVVIVVRKTWR